MTVQTKTLSGCINNLFKVPSDAAQIKPAALNYNFPVLFMYVPEYWKKTIFEIANNELAGPFINNQYIKQWLEEHK